MPTQFALSVYEFLANKKTTVISLAPYSLHLVSCDLFVFPEPKMALKGGRFNDITIVWQKCGMLLRRFKQCTLQNVCSSKGITWKGQH